MNYGYTTLATDWDAKQMRSLGVRLLKVILFFIPAGNPDQEKLYPFVKKWFIEIDENGVPNREIGLDSENNPLFIAPNDRNCGYWIDSPKTFSSDELEPGDKKQFELLWQKAGG